MNECVANDNTISGVTQQHFFTNKDKKMKRTQSVLYKNKLYLEIYNLITCIL